TSRALPGSAPRLRRRVFSFTVSKGLRQGHGRALDFAPPLPNEFRLSRPSAGTGEKTGRSAFATGYVARQPDAKQKIQRCRWNVSREEIRREFFFDRERGDRQELCRHEEFLLQSLRNKNFHPRRSGGECEGERRNCLRQYSVCDQGKLSRSPVLRFCQGGQGA